MLKSDWDIQSSIKFSNRLRWDFYSQFLIVYAKTFTQNLESFAPKIFTRNIFKFKSTFKV